MALSILPSGTNLGEQIGSSLGGGIGEALKALAEQKAFAMQQKQQGNALQSLFPSLNQEQMQGLNILPPELQQLFLKETLSAPRNQAFAQALGLGTLSQEPMNGINTLNAEMPSIQGKTNQIPQLSEKQALEVSKLRQKENAIDQKVKLQKEERTGKIWDELIAEKNKNRDKITNLEEMIRVNDEGNLPLPIFNAVLDAFNINLGSLLSGDAQYYRSLQKNLFHDLKEIFGARPNMFDVQQFVSALPTLSNTQEGRAKILKKLDYLSKAKNAFLQSKEDVINENNGIAPANISYLADQKAQKKIDKLYSKFKEGVNTTSSSLPAPQSYKMGAKATNNTTGETLYNTGTEWVDKKKWHQFKKGK